MPDAGVWVMFGRIFYFLGKMIFAYSYKLTIILRDTTEDIQVVEDQDRTKTKKKISRD